MPIHLETFSKHNIKWAIIALLGINILIYAFSKDYVAAVDALSWVALFVLYELESQHNWAKISQQSAQTLRTALIILITLVFFTYLGSKAWLDVSNAVLWFMLIGLLELEIRQHNWVQQHPKIFWLLTVLVFIGLLFMVAVWLLESSWLDAYDATLWIIAFALLEVDIFQFLQLPAKQ